MFRRKDYEFPKYKEWNIIDLFDYLTDYYADMAQEEPDLYAARIPMTWYDLQNADDVEWLNTYGIETNGVWYYADNVFHTKYVSSFKHMSAIWRSDLPDNGKYRIQYVSPQRNDYVISAGAFIQILRERYADFYFLTSFKYNYETEKREFPKTLAEASVYLLDTLRVFKHDKQDALTKLLYALRKEYDPVENYDKISEIETEFKGSEFTNKKPLGKEKNELTRIGQEKTSNNSTDTLSKTTYDDVQFKGAEKTVGDLSSTLEYSPTVDGTEKTRKDTTELSFTDREDKGVLTYGKDINGNTDKRINKTTERTHGNIGVTTSQQMIQSQFPVEMYDEIEHYVVSQFAQKYLITH